MCRNDVPHAGGCEGCECFLAAGMSFTTQLWCHASTRLSSSSAVARPQSAHHGSCNHHALGYALHQARDFATCIPQCNVGIQAPACTMQGHAETLRRTSVTGAPQHISCKGVSPDSDQ